MSDQEIQELLDNARRGIAENKPHWVISSSRRLKQDFNRFDLAEEILREAFPVFSRNVQVFRELATTITEQDATEGLRFADQHIDRFGEDARFQKAVALAKLNRHLDAAGEIEESIAQNPKLKEDRHFVSKLMSIYNTQGEFDKGVDFLEPLIDKGVYRGKDFRMKQTLATHMVKARRSPQKVLELLEGDSTTRGTFLKNRANEILGTIGLSDFDVSSAPSTDTQEVFIVHGHDPDTVQKLELLLHKIGVEPVHFRNIPHSGSTTNVEILEQAIPRARAIIVSMSADDEGREKDSGEPLKPRVRQNVLIEAGYAVLSKRDQSILLTLGVGEDFDLPSDFDGINRVHGSEWSREIELDIAQRLENMGLNVSLASI